MALKQKSTKKYNTEVDDNTLILCDDGQTINKLYQISDIHISRFDDRHNEFLTVFQRTADEIKKDTKNALIVICGDIVHDKIVMSPLQISLVKKFFIMMSDILPCVVIIGNHDVNLNSSTLDAVSPLLDKLQTTNKIHLLLDNKNYIYNNVVFGVTTMFAKNVTPCNTKNKIRIGLYHGIVAGAKVENGFMIGNVEYFKVDDFKQHYDYVLLGDIHKFCYMDQEKRVAYSGSLLQLRFGEDLLDHGFLKWNILNGTSEFCRIKNDYGLVKIKCNNEGIIDNLDEIIEMPPNLTIKMEYENITQMQAETYLGTLRDKYNAKCLLVRTVKNNMDITFGSGNDKTKIADVNNNNVVIQMIIDFMKQSGKYEADVVARAQNKISEILQTLDYKYCNVVKKFKLLSLKFDNFFNFGAGNEINYTKLKGIIGIDGGSFIGKSTSATDVLIYALFGETIRGRKFDAVNVNKKSMTTDVEFELNDDRYRIMRRRNRIESSKKSKESNGTVVLYKNGIDISKEKVDVTNNEIKNMLCDHTNFINIAMMLQGGNVSFVDLSDKDRKDLICGLLKLDILNDIHSVAKGQVSQINRRLSDLRCCDGVKTKNDFFDKYGKTKIITKEIEKLGAEFNESMHIMQNLETKTGALKKDVIMHELKFNAIKDNVGSDVATFFKSNIKKVNKDLEEYKKDIKNNIEKLNTHKTSANSINKQIKQLEIKIKKMGDVEGIYSKFKQTNDIQIEQLTKELESLLAQRVPICSNINEEIIANEKKLNSKLKADAIKYEQLIDDLEKNKVCANKPRNIKTNYEALCTAKKNVIEFDKHTHELQNELQNLELKYTGLENHKYNPECDYCIQYPITKDKIECEKRIREIKKMLDERATERIKINVIIEKNNKYEKIYNDYVIALDKNKQCACDIEKFSTKLLITKKDIEISDGKLVEYDKYIKTESINREIDEKCTNIRKQITSVRNTKCNEYVAYNELKNKKASLVDENNKIQTQISDVDNAINKLNYKVKEMEQSIELYNKHKENIECMEKVRNEYNQKKDEYDKFELELNKQKIRHNDLNNSIIKKKTELEFETKNVDEYVTKEKDKELLEIIMTVLDKNGLVDRMLTDNIMPKIESDVNQMLDMLVNYKINMTYVNGHFNMYKTNDTKQINIETLSGCEQFMLNVVFRLVLEQYNNYVKTGFLVIDELFNCCDSDNISKMPLLFDHLRNQYEFCIIISHDERIKKLYDTTIEVVRTKNESFIKF